ncbi:MAG: CoA transferase [Austwickia sp.]|nr:CoA transferase [Austwickia sp.]
MQPTVQPPVRPLTGIRVIELGNFIAAPTAGRLLADFGAEVIKIERPRTGDEIRRWRLYDGQTSMLYRTVNRNKLSVELDLRTDAGRQAVLDLLSHSDVLIENFRPGTLDRWGLDAEALTAANPELVVARISAFGQTGPMAARPGFAAVAEGFGGLRALIGEPDRPPARTGVSLGDSVAGVYAAFGVVMALYQGERLRSQGRPTPTPAQQHIDVALHEAVFSLMESLVPEYSAHGVVRRRTGGRMEGIAPSNAYVCGDGSSVVIGGNGDAIFGRFMTVIGRPDLRDDPAMADNPGRWAARERLDEAIGAWTGTLPREEVLAQLEAADVPAGPIYEAADIIADPQYAARAMVQHLPVEIGGQIREVAFPGIVPLLGPASLPVHHVGPDLGEHTQEVFERVLGRAAPQP